MNREATLPSSPPSPRTTPPDDRKHAWHSSRNSALEARITSEPTTQISLERVRFLQRVLNATEGGQLVDDGLLGELTCAALRRFRSKHGLPEVRSLDAATEVGLTQRALEQITQAALFETIGRCDAKTEQMLANFRTERGLGTGSALDAGTRAALTEALTSAASSAARARSTATVREYLGGKLWTFEATTLATPVAVFVSKSAITHHSVDLLLFVHGYIDGCVRPGQLPAAFITAAPFDLGTIVAASSRPIVLVAPLLDWVNPGGAEIFGPQHAHWHALAQPATLNALLAEVLVEVARLRGGVLPSLGELIIAAHSRAHDFLEPLAHSGYGSRAAGGALAHLEHIWAFETPPIADVSGWNDWLRLDPRLDVAYFSRPQHRRLAKPSIPATSSRTPAPHRASAAISKDDHGALLNRQLPSLLRLGPGTAA